MSKPRSVSDGRGYRDISRAVRSQGGYERGRRNHVEWGNDRGYVVGPRHPGDYATGTRHAIVKALLALGFFMIVFVVYVCLAEVAATTGLSLGGY